MKALLTSDFRRLRKNKLVYVLLILALILPAFTTSVLYFLIHFLGETEVILLPVLAHEHYAQSFSLLNNIGLFTIIFITLIISKDFTDFTIRNKIIAGYSRTKIYFSVLIVNLSLVFAAMFLNSTATYVVALLFEGFDRDAFKQIIAFGVIAYSSLLMLFTFHTLLLFKFKKVAGTLLLTMGVLFLILIAEGINGAINTLSNNNFPVVYYMFPVIRLLIFTPKGATEWYYALLANVIHVSYLIPLSVLLANKTDFK